MPKDPLLYLDDILEAIDHIHQFLADMNFEQFSQDKKTQYAILRCLEIIEEASGRLLSNYKNIAPEIEWRKIIALRNILIHEYFGISLPIVWDVIQNKLAPLEESCKILLEQLKN